MSSEEPPDTVEGEEKVEESEEKEDEKEQKVAGDTEEKEEESEEKEAGAEERGSKGEDKEGGPHEGGGGEQEDAKNEEVAMLNEKDADQTSTGSPGKTDTASLKDTQKKPPPPIEVVKTPRLTDAEVKVIYRSMKAEIRGGKRIFEFPKWVKLPPKPKPRKPKPKLDFPDRETEGVRVGCCGRLFGGHVVEHYHWPLPDPPKKIRSVPVGMRLNQVFPSLTPKHKPHISISLPHLPSMETNMDDWYPSAGADEMMDEDDPLRHLFGGFPKFGFNRNANACTRQRHTSAPHDGPVYI